MELRSECKQTELGFIPKDWEISMLADYAFITKLAGFEYTLHFNYLLSGPIIAVRALNIKNGTLDLSEIHTIPQSVSNLLPRSKLEKGDLVISYVGTLGRVAVIPQDDKFHLAPNVAKICVKKSAVSPEFLCHYLNSFSGQKSIFEAAASTTQAALSMGNLRKIAFPRPHLIEQKAIAEALSDADALIESLDQLIAKKRQIKQGAMQELLTCKRRLPGFSGEWEVKRLGDICEIGMGRTPPRLNSSFWGAGHKWLSIADLKSKVVTESKEEITPLAAEEMQVVRKGTLLMSFKLSIGRLCFAGCDLYTNEAICSFNQLKANSDFLYYILGRTDFSLYGKQAVKGYTLNKESLKLVEVPLPSILEQTAIASVLSDMDTELAALESRLAKARQIKQGMMQELLTGRIRLL